jgi:hypothetical protein
LKITEGSQLFGLLFHKKTCINFYKKIGWATFWAIFSQTRLVTLVEMDGDSDLSVERSKILELF